MGSNLDPKLFSQIIFPQSISISTSFSFFEQKFHNLIFIASRDRNETDPNAYVTAYTIEKLRNKHGEKEMTAHFENKRGFVDLEFDGKASKTKQENGIVSVKSNVTCISDGTFLEFFQPEDGCDPTYGNELHKVVKKYNADETLIFIGSDSTAVNTGL